LLPGNWIASSEGQVADGLFEPILELPVHMNHSVLGFRYIRLDDTGSPVDRARDDPAPDKNRNKGVQIDFRTDNDGSVHTLLYLSVNLSDQMLRNNAAFLSFLSRLNGSTTFLKATSYMRHKSEFSIVRDQLLSNSVAILQDDSGIPYRFLQTGT
jgi:hypothetical protein